MAQAPFTVFLRELRLDSLASRCFQRYTRGHDMGFPGLGDPDICRIPHARLNLQPRNGSWCARGMCDLGSARPECGL
jgi:hypothetical protein